MDIVQENPGIMEIKNRYKKRIQIIEEWLSAEQMDAKSHTFDLQENLIELQKEGKYRVIQLRLEKCVKRQKLLEKMMEETMAQEHTKLWAEKVDDQFISEFSMRCEQEYKTGEIDKKIAQEWSSRGRIIAERAEQLTELSPSMDSYW